MTKVRVLVGTRKGAFVLTADGTRENWEVAGPHFAGWEIYHVKGSPADPDRIYASQTSGWFGQLIQRSDDGGATWQPVGNEFRYDGVPGTHQWYDGTPHPWEFARVWHLEPSLDRSGHGVRRRRGRRRCSGRPTAGRPGTSCPACAAMAPGRPGSPALAACACTPSCSTRSTRTGCSSRSRPRARSAPTMAATAGSRSTRACARRASRTRRRGRPLRAPHRACTRRGPTCCSCRSTGT